MVKQVNGVNKTKWLIFVINKHNSLNVILFFESIILHLSIRIRLRLGIDFVNYIISNIQDQMKFVGNFVTITQTTISSTSFTLLHLPTFTGRWWFVVLNLTNFYTEFTG